MPKDPDRRQRILNFIRDFIEERARPPTLREIQKGCGLTAHRPVQYHLGALEREGLIQRTPYTSRGIQLVGAAPGSAEVPLLGTIAAGEPIPVPSPDTWTVAPEDVIKVRDVVRIRENTYALRVKGTSMIDALVDDGDIVILQPTPTAEDGEMVAAWLTDREEATLKRLYREPDRIRLQPANRAIPPIYVDPENILVQGKVVAVLRSLE